MATFTVTVTPNQSNGSKASASGTFSGGSSSYKGQRRMDIVIDGVGTFSALSAETSGGKNTFELEITGLTKGKTYSWKASLYYKNTSGNWVTAGTQYDKSGSFTTANSGTTSTVPLSAKAVRSTVKMNVNGAAKEFIIVHKGKPSSMYDDSCDGVWLLMKDIYEMRQWNSNSELLYENSSIHSYLNSTFLRLLDANIQSAIKQVKIPYLKGGKGGSVQSGANGLSCKVFLLGGYELNFRNIFPADGAGLDGFAESITNNSTYLATYNGALTKWWLRSISTLQYSNNAGLVSGYTYNSESVTESKGIRPALILPSNLSVDADGMVITNTPPTITSPSGATGVSLGEKKDKFSFTYVPHDEDGDTMSVVERLDGVAMKSRTGVASGTSLTFECASTDAGFREILNGEHVITIEVSDGSDTATFTANFTKAVHEASIMLETPMAVEGAISVAIMAVVNSIPDDAEYKVEATNNANDDNPVWQDVTADVKNGTNFVFTNGVAANGSAFNFRITAKRGASGEGGYISAVSGAFQ